MAVTGRGGSDGGGQAWKDLRYSSQIDSTGLTDALGGLWGVTLS